MKIIDTYIKGLKVIELNQYSDIRGGFIKVFNHDFFIKNELETNMKESYFSASRKNVIRGMHFQSPPYEHTKLVYVNQGSILDVVLDIRLNSDTYGIFFNLQLTSKEPKLIYIPIGCAHGFLSLEEETIVTYLQSSVYSEINDNGIKYNSFGMDWGLENPIISERDNNFIGLGNFKSPF
jgi:dTDP-4-dehydrorhamnose 3,5-epimerase